MNVEVFGGFWLKPLSDKQIEKTWNSGMIKPFMQSGERYADIATEMYVVASRSR